MNPFDGIYHKEVTIRTRKRKRSHSKVFDYVMKCLRERKHIHMLRYKAGTNKTQFEVDFYDMKVHNQWNLKCISLFMAVDKIVKEERQKEINYCQNTKNRFKSNMRKLENKYIKFLYEDKKSTALRIKSYRILNPPAVHQIQQQNIVPAVLQFQSVERQQFQVPGGSMIVVPPGGEIHYQGSQFVDVHPEPGTEINVNFEIPDESEIVNVEEIDDCVVEEAHASFTRLPGQGLKYKDVIKDDKFTPAAKKAKFENGSDCSRSSGLDKQNIKENIMVSSLSETTLVLVEMTDSLKGRNFPDLKVMDGYQPSDVMKMINSNDILGIMNSEMINGNDIPGIMNSEMINGNDIPGIMNSEMINGNDIPGIMNSEMINGNDIPGIMNSEMINGNDIPGIMNSEMINGNDIPGIMNSEMINGNDIPGIMNSEMINGNDILDFMNSDTINCYGKLGIMNSEKNRYEDKENYIEVSDYSCLLENYEDKVPLNSYQNDFTLDIDENNVLYGDPFNGEKPNIEVSSNEMALDLDFDGEVGIETLPDIHWCNEFLKDLPKFN